MKKAKERGGSLVALREEIMAGDLSQDRLKELIENVLCQVRGCDVEAKKAQLIDLFVLCFDIGLSKDGRDERTVFIWYFIKLYRLWPQVSLRLLPLIPEYLSWRALNELYEKAYEDQKLFFIDHFSLLNHILWLYKTQLENDSCQAQAGAISSAAKWAPRLNSVCDQHCGMARALCTILFSRQVGGVTGMSTKPLMEQNYRQLLRHLLSQSQCSEVTTSKMTGKRSEIECECDSSMCNQTWDSALEALSIRLNEPCFNPIRDMCASELQFS